MRINPGKPEYQQWASRARDLASRATTETARKLHLAIAEEYEAKAAAAMEPETERVADGGGGSDAAG